MRKFTSIIIVALLSAAILIFYSLEIASADSLIRPPEYSAEGGSVQLALEAEIGKKYILKTPMQGENRSAYIYRDLNYDGEKEAVVLYSANEHDDSVTMGIFEKTDLSWRFVASVTCPYTEVLQIDFADIDLSGTDDIIVGYSLYGSEINQRLFVYSVDTSDSDNPMLITRFDAPYSKYILSDVDADNCCDLVVLNSPVSGVNQGYTVKAVSFAEKPCRVKGSVVLDSALRIVSAVCCDTSASGSARIYVDGYTADGKMITDAVTWNPKKERLERLRLQSGSLPSVTVRTRTAVCADIDEDGVIEIPTDYALPGSKQLGTKTSRNISLLRYVRIRDGRLEDAACYFENAENGYYFRYSKNFLKTATVIVSADATSVKFYTVREKENGEAVADKLLFEVRTVTDLETGRVPQSYKSLGQNKGYYYYCRIYQNGEQVSVTVSGIRKKMIFDLKGCTR